MKPAVFLLIIISSVHTFAQEAKISEREQKFQEILQVQDRRTLQDIKIVSFLTDQDPAIRARTALAYASIQDTTALSLLVDRLNDPDPVVQRNAAFAIGQTASQLSKRSKENFEHDLVWNRLENMSSVNLEKSRSRERNYGSPLDRMIEEIGKFGTQQALTDLIGKFGNEYPATHESALIMSIARFGIRGIVTSQGVEYLLRFVKDPNRASWRAVYALQRGIGNHKLVRENLDYISKLYKHSNPLLRMNLATLLGKTKDEHTSLEPLMKMAEFDSDWRVKVNALKALGNFTLQGKDDLLRLFRRAFSDGNPYIAMTAISAFGSSGTKKDSSEASRELFELLERIAVNNDNGYLWQLQAVADTTLAGLEGRAAFPLIDPARASNSVLQSQMIYALGVTGAVEALPQLLDYAGREESRLRTAALGALQELSQRNPDNKDILEKTFQASLAAAKSTDVAVVGTAASILRDERLINVSTVPVLLETLNSLHVPDDVEAMQEIIQTLERLNGQRVVEPLKALLEVRDRSVVFAAAAALKKITGQDYSQSIPQEFEPAFVDYDFSYLNSLPDTIHVKMETLRGNVVMELYKNIAPFTVMSLLKLATQRGYFRGKSFHRVVPNFVVQGGDPRGDGWGGPGYAIRSEFTPLSYETGSVGMASAGKDTEGSQFFITQSPQPHLYGRYTLFGKVISGMDVINRMLIDDHILELAVTQ